MMKKLVASVLITLALVVTADAQSVKRPVPQFVESLSDADYATWARWQNRQAKRRSKELSAASTTPRYNYAERVESSTASRGSASTRSRAYSTREGTASSYTARGRTASARRGTASSRTTRGGITATQFGRRATSVTTAYRLRYNNPDYSGPGPLVIYNPWSRVTGGYGTPDWDRIFVPVKEGTLTVSEAMDQLSGPRSQEKVFKLLISDYFSESS